MTATNKALERISRHALLREVGPAGCGAIARTRFLVVGAGGVGCPAALALAEAGVASITIVDSDAVDISNLPRQILHTESRVGVNKAVSAKTALAEINPAVPVRAVDRWADEALLAELAAEADLVLDCSDNFKTRHAVSRAARRAGVPLITASSVRFSMQLAFFDFTDPASACYQCTFPEDEGTDVRASAVGVFAPVTGIAGMTAANEALKWAAGVKTLAGKLLIVDTLTWEAQTLALWRDPACPVCSAGR